MSALIKIQSKVIGTESVNSVNARDLHKTLEIDKKFADWINHQINSLGLEINVDYITYAEKGNGRPQKEYIITTDTAKHISMASRTAKGKEVRNYFIEIDKEFKKSFEFQGKSIPHVISGLKSGLSKKDRRIAELEDLLRSQALEVLEEELSLTAHEHGNMSEIIFQMQAFKKDLEVIERTCEVKRMAVENWMRVFERNYPKCTGYIKKLDERVDITALRSKYL